MLLNIEIPVSYPEDLPAEGALAADEYPGEFPEAGGGHVPPANREGAPIPDRDVTLQHVTRDMRGSWYIFILC